jgi:hypothetical protein
MPRLRRPFALGLAASLVCLQIAVAASLPTTATKLGGGTAAVSSCDADGFTYHHTVDTSGNITAVNVSSIANACAGGTLQLTLASGTTSVGSGTVSLPSSGFSGSVAVAVSPTPSSSAVTAVYVVVEGP